MKRPIIGFKFQGHAGMIRDIWEDVFTSAVEITSGRPCYDKSRGLKIYSSQTIAAFMSKAFPSPIQAKLHPQVVGEDPRFDKVSATTIQVGNGQTPDLLISFMRTVRVPESDRYYNLPPGLGRFPVFNLAPFSPYLPTSMVAQGGLFFPMYRTFCIERGVLCKF
jgi:hypothetical protein